jgi:hypothetical protein
VYDRCLEHSSSANPKMTLNLCPPPHSLPTAIQFASDTTCPLSHSLSTATQLASDIQFASGIQLTHHHTDCHTDYQLPQSLPTVYSLLTATQLANGVQIANCHKLANYHSLPAVIACPPPANQTWPPLQGSPQPQVKAVPRTKPDLAEKKTCYD